MNSIAEFTRTDESVIVSRVLLLVHSEIDRSFPNQTLAPKQFRKTVFSEVDTNTALNQPKSDEDGPTLINRIIPPPPQSEVGREQNFADLIPPPPRSDLNLLEGEEDRKKKGKKPISNPGKTITKAISQFPEFSKIEENPYFIERRRRRLMNLLIFLVLLGIAGAIYFYYGDITELGSTVMEAPAGE